MQNVWRLVVFWLIFVAAPTLACQPADAESQMLEQPDPLTVCDESADEASLYQPGVQQIHIYEQEEKPDYWEQWSADIVDSPIVSGGSELSHFGLSVWQPDEEASIVDMAYSEWIMSHGLQFSLGIGDPKEPKIRLDYQWHDIQDDQLTLQVEVPF